MSKKAVRFAAAGLIAAAALTVAGARVSAGRSRRAPVLEPPAEARMWQILSAEEPAEQVLG